MLRQEKLEFRQEFSPAAKTRSPAYPMGHTPQLPALNFMSSSSKRRQDQGSNQPPGNTLLISAHRAHWECILMRALLLSIRFLRRTFIMLPHFIARPEEKLKQLLVSRDPHQTFCLCTFLFISGMRQNLGSLPLRRQEAFPLTLKQQAEKQKLLFNKQRLLHAALILC